MKEIIDEINQFRDARGWRKHHQPKDLAISISIEAAELLEDFQWKSDQEAVADNYENIKEEIADVLIYALTLTEALELDPKEIIREKLKKNAIKYPEEV